MLEVCIIDLDRVEILRLAFPDLVKARAFAKCAIVAMRIKTALILKDGEKFEGYELDAEGNPGWLVF